MNCMHTRPMPAQLSKSNPLVPARGPAEKVAVPVPRGGAAHACPLNLTLKCYFVEFAQYP